jgi:hypothetical protein
LLQNWTYSCFKTQQNIASIKQTPHILNLLQKLYQIMKVARESAQSCITIRKHMTLSAQKLKLHCVTWCEGSDVDRPVPYEISWNERELLVILTTIIKTFTRVSQMKTVKLR